MKNLNEYRVVGLWPKLSLRTVIWSSLISLSLLGSCTRTDISHKTKHDNYDVSYFEGYPKALSSYSNIMVLKNNSLTYRLTDVFDTEGYSSILASDYGDQKLDRIDVEVNVLSSDSLPESVVKHFYRPSVDDPNSLDVEHARRMFDKADSLYNLIRKQIRSEIKSDYNKSEIKLN